VFAARLRAYAPGGASLGLLPDPLSWQASIVHGDLGALSVTYSTLSAGGEHIERSLASGLEVAVEVWDGTTWVEPRGCRFVRVAQGADTADDMQVYSVTFRAYGWLLTKARLTAGTFTDGRRVFTAPKPGPLMTTILGENAAIGGVPVTVVGGGTNDAGGAAWAALPDQGFEYAADYLGIVRGLQEAGALDWATQARGLYLYLPDSTALSPDLSATVRLALGSDIGEAPADETIENLVSQVAVRAQAGGTVVVEEPTAPTPHGEWQGSLAVGQVDNQSAAEAMGQAELERSGHAREQYTRALVLHDEAPVPLVDYWPGSWITAPTSVPAESVRVQQVTLTFGPDGYGGNVVLNDRLVEGDIRRARTLGTLAGGQVGSGGAPSPIAVDPEASRVPSTPTGLDVVAGITFTGPTPRGVVTATWNPVSTATDTGALAISGYELQYRIGAGAWQTIVTPEVSAIIADLTPGDALDSRVRAVGARTTLPSAWSAIDSVTVPGDVTAPPVPTGLSTSTARGIVTVVWDGTPAMPVDLDRIEIAIDGTATPTTVVGTLRKAGELPHPDTVGATRRARARSVDTTGNVSAWSSVLGPVTVASVVSADIDTAVTNAIATAGTDAANALTLGQRVVIASTDNLVVDPTFSTLSGGAYDPAWDALATNEAYDATGGYNGVGSWKVTLDGAVHIVAQAGTKWRLVEPGSAYRMGVWVRSDVALPANAITSYIQRRIVGGATAVLVQVIHEPILANTPTYVSTGIGVMPADGDAVRVVLQVAAAAGLSGNVWLSKPSVTRAADATLYVDGSVKARHVGAEEIETGHLAAGAVSADKLSSVIAVSGLFTTSESGTGQRVEFDNGGIRLFNAADELRIDFPTTPGDEPEIRGVVQADGLTVRQGATFFSPLNSFAKDSTISLDESLSRPTSAPLATPYWNSAFFQITPRTGDLGTFALDPSLIQSVAWNHVINVVHLVQKVATGGTRIWYYNLDGTIWSGGTPYWDLPSAWDVSSLGIGTDGEFRIMYRWDSRWWIYDYSRPSGSRSREYASAVNPAGRPLMAMDGNTIVATETGMDEAPRFRYVDTSTNPVTITSGVTATGAPGNSGRNPVFLYHGSADYGGQRWITSYKTSGSYRTFSEAGAFASNEGWDPPTTKVGAFWHPGLGVFYTVSSDGGIWAHSAMTWTSSANDTWHLGQTFYDNQVTGGLHETAMGEVRSFTMPKRAFLRVTLVEVPYAGGTDDPNRWRLYGMRGTYAVGSMRLQSEGAYTTLTHTMSAVPTTGGAVAPTTSTFPGGNPARLVSARVMPDTLPVIDLRGDGSGRLGQLQISSAGVISFASSYDTGWVNVSLAGGITNVSTPYTLQVRRLGFVVYIRGQITGLAADVDTQITGTAMAAEFRPIVTVQLGLIPTGGNLNTQYARVQIQDTGHIRVRSLTSANAYLFGSWTND
jgi:hypothetical protein